MYPCILCNFPLRSSLKKTREDPGDNQLHQSIRAKPVSKERTEKSRAESGNWREERIFVVSDCPSYSVHAVSGSRGTAKRFLKVATRRDKATRAFSTLFFSTRNRVELFRKALNSKIERHRERGGGGGERKREKKEHVLQEKLKGEGGGQSKGWRRVCCSVLKV